jgi:hypothetical protein
MLRLLLLIVCACCVEIRAQVDENEAQRIHVTVLDSNGTIVNTLWRGSTFSLSHNFSQAFMNKYMDPNTAAGQFFQFEYVLVWHGNPLPDTITAPYITIGTIFVYNSFVLFTVPDYLPNQNYTISLAQYNGAYYQGLPSEPLYYNQMIPTIYGVVQLRSPSVSNALSISMSTSMNSCTPYTMYANLSYPFSFVTNNPMSTQIIVGFKQRRLLTQETSYGQMNIGPVFSLAAGSTSFNYTITDAFLSTVGLYTYSPWPGPVYVLEVYFIITDNVTHSNPLWLVPMFVYPSSALNKTSYHNGDYVSCSGSSEYSSSSSSTGSNGMHTSSSSTGTHINSAVGAVISRHVPWMLLAGWSVYVLVGAGF